MCFVFYTVTCFCQNLGLAKAIFNAAIDGITGGALELFPNVDLEALRQEKTDLLSKVRNSDGVKGGTSKDSISAISYPNQRRPPQFLKVYPQLNEMLYALFFVLFVIKRILSQKIGVIH